MSLFSLKSQYSGRPAAFRLQGDVLEVIAQTVNGHEAARCPSTSRFSTRRSMWCARAMSSLACVILGARAPFMSIALGFWSATRPTMRFICAASRSATIIRSCCGADVHALGFKLASEDDVDRAAAWFARRNLPTAFPDVPHQGRTLRTADIFGTPLELYAQMDQRPSMLQKYATYQGARIQRIDHLNCFTPDVQGSYDFYAALGFRLTEYSETDGADPKLWAVWLQRKGNVHDLAFTNGAGPRLHHVGVWTASVLDIIHICDVMATSGYLANMERGPGRHGIELFTSDYLTVDPDHAPIRWSLTDPQRQTLWGHPAPASWFEQGSLFTGVVPREPTLAAQPIVAH